MDTRRRTSTPNAALPRLYWSVCYLEAFFPREDQKGEEKKIGTGVLISENMVLTTGHNVWCETMPRLVYVSPAANSN